MASLNHVTREAVLNAMAEYDRLGSETFLRQYGYRPASKWTVRSPEGRSYPSKAILGVAAGLSAQDFFGGIAQTVGRLCGLGFQVRKGQRVVVDHDLYAMAKAAGFEDTDPRYSKGLPVEPTAYFASGSNRPGQPTAMANVGMDIGVAADQVSPTVEAELKGLAGTDVLVFVDSGAFGEVSFQGGELVVTKPISDAEWAKRLSLYKRLGAVLGDQLVAVAPDRVGSQDETLARLERYKADVLELREMGVRVLVAIQKGALSQADFAAKVDEILGANWWTPALPCKKAATTPAEVEAFLAARAPKHVHLLGLGARNPYVADYLRPFVGQSTTVSLDSNWITASSGSKGNKGRAKDRRHTAAKALATAVSGMASKGARFAQLAILIAFGLNGVLTWTGAWEQADACIQMAA